jgi:hypothetical protein
MVLAVLSDASYLSRPRARSATGSFRHLSRVPLSGLPSDARTFINAPLSCHSNVIPVVCSSVQEAKYAGVFAAARLADEERRIIHNLGYSQPPTLLLCDNEYAVGLASKTMTPRLSKSIDMRFHWLQDRIQRGQFRVQRAARRRRCQRRGFFHQGLASHQARPICTVLRPGSCSSRQGAPISSSVLLIHIVCTIIYNQASVLIP